MNVSIVISLPLVDQYIYIYIPVVKVYPIMFQWCNVSSTFVFVNVIAALPRRYRRFAGFGVID